MSKLVSLLWITDPDAVFVVVMTRYSLLLTMAATEIVWHIIRSRRPECVSTVPTFVDANSLAIYSAVFDFCVDALHLAQLC